MADIKAPVLKRLVLPSALDLNKGPQAIQFLAEAVDEAGGSGMANVNIWFDRHFDLSGYSSQILQLGYAATGDNFADATPTVAQDRITVLDTTPAGTFTVREVWVTDLAGNRTVYDTAQLKALGATTAIAVTGPVMDSAPPALASLKLPATLDLSAGPATLSVAAEAFDNAGGAGIDYMMLQFDKPIAFEGRQGQFMVVGMVGDDRFDDATPTTAVSEERVSAVAAPGDYSLLGVDLYDRAGNKTSYTQGQLQSMGIGTSMKVTGGVVDTAPPMLVELRLPATVALNMQPRQLAAAVVLDAPGGSGVDYVSVWFDRPLHTEWGSSEILSVGGSWSPDNFRDATSTYGTASLRFSSATATGTYNVTRVFVTDIAGNAKEYSATELKRMGINTTMKIIEGTPTAELTPSAAGDKLQLSLLSRDWATTRTDSFSLTLKYDPTQAHYSAAALGAASATPLKVVASEVGHVGTLTISATGPIAQSEALQLTMAINGAGAFDYTIAEFTVNGKSQLVAPNGTGTIRYGTDGADRIDNADTAVFVDGGKGLDQLVFADAQSGFQFRKTTGGIVIDNFIDTNLTMANVERVLFADKAVAFDIDGNAGKVYRLYQAAFDRTPDEGGLGYWIWEMDSGATLETIAEQFILSDEFRGKYGIQPGEQDFVTALYANVLNRLPDQGGFDFWTGVIKSRADYADVLVQFSESPENAAQVIGSIQNGIHYLPVI